MAVSFDQLNGLMEKHFEDLRGIHEEEKVLSEKQLKVMRLIGELRELCPHPEQKKFSHPVTGDQCGVCLIEWDTIANELGG